MEEAVADVPDERMAEQFPGLPNHPAWSLTHLATAFDFTHVTLGGQRVCPAEWVEISKPGSTPQADRDVYAAKEELLAKYRDAGAALEETCRNADADLWQRESPEALQSFAPTLGHLATFMLAGHDLYHLGQLMPWRRAAGLTK